MIPARRVAWLAAAAAAAGWALDLAGVALDRPVLWGVGHALVPATTAAALLAALLLAVRRRPGVAAASAVAATLLALAAWVRAHPAIPPDPAVLLVEGLATAALALLALRAAATPRQAPQ